MLLSASSLGIPMPCKLQMATQLPVAVPSSHNITSSMNTEDVLLDELDRMDG
ncbi:hypothetical protein HaLaN_25436 [Haematococcus lacustris]|uniref:Uncharacterized protein n=1 Tax=Haematococcus lacustris TaxID=44745 RepID=A0A699ZXI9_HAELA|nr:hypothetical protein HaLaN_25436 [Haematococcus lacustris]